jgi:hypothetical protein
MLTPHRTLWALVLLSFYVPDALAYVDPGSGILAWQGALAAFGAVLVFVRNPIQILKKWLRRRRDK